MKTYLRIEIDNARPSGKYLQALSIMFRCHYDSILTMVLKITQKETDKFI